ncbi:MAG: YaaR family protein [Clostridia bacterium]|nr:YaaR family protein [Clostridia bacterium]
MKISESLNKSSNLSGFSGAEDRRVSDNKEASFQSHIRRVESNNLEERINSLVSRIAEQGEKLAKKADIRELKIYKKLISEFMDEAVNNSHKFSKKNMLDRRGRHKVYAVVKKVNEELENLTKEVLSAEKNNIKILNSLEDIRGLILDLTL